MMDDLRARVTIDPEQCGGRPCIRGMRIRVIDILDLYAAELTEEQILEERPDLEMDDLTAALRYAAQRLDHPNHRRERESSTSYLAGLPVVGSTQRALGHPKVRLRHEVA